MTEGHDDSTVNIVLLGIVTIIYATAFWQEADAYVLQMFFFVFSPSVKNMRQPFSGMAEQIFMKLLPNDTGGNVV